MITNFLFDIGNVVWHYQPLLDQLLHRWSEISQLDYNTFYQKYLEFYRLAEVNSATLADFAKSLNCPPQVLSNTLAEIYQPNFNQYLNQPVLNLIQNLRSVFKVGYLSNAENFFYPQVHQRLDHLFDYGYSSWQLSVRKPDPQAYLQVLKLQNLLPQEVVFIDDTLANLTVPQQLGLHTIHFQNNHHFLLELQKLNIKN